MARLVAPQGADVFVAWKCQRQGLLDECTEANPEHEYRYISTNRPPEYLAREDMEVVHMDDINKDCPENMKGRPLMHRNDIVVRRKPSRGLEEDRERCDQSRRKVKRNMEDQKNQDAAKWQPRDYIRSRKNPHDLVHPSEIEDRFVEEETRFAETKPKVEG